MTLREWREQQGMTLRDAGNFFGWSHAWQFDLETKRGGRSPTLRTVDRVERMTHGAVTRLDWPKEET